MESRAHENRQKLLIVACAKIGEFSDEKLFRAGLNVSSEADEINRFIVHPHMPNKDEE